MKRMVTHLVAGLALLCTAALPANAEENHGPPPAVGSVLTPSPRIVCRLDGILDIAFQGSSELQKVHSGLVAAQMLTVNGEHVCAMVGFGNPITIVDNKKIGAIVLPDQSEFDAYAMHGKFPNGQEIWGLWLEMTKDAPKVEYRLKCDAVTRCV